MKLSEFEFELPPELIAQAPLAERSSSRLLVLPRGDGTAHHRFADLPQFLPRGTLLVLNETRVIPARLRGRRATGGKVEVLLVRPLEAGTGGEPSPPGATAPGAPLDGAADDAPDWEALVQCGGRLRPPDEVVEIGDGAARLRLVAQLGPGRYRVRCEGGDALEVAERAGEMPPSPYIHRPAGPVDRATYQTVFARVPGAIAAPTAGLHFTPELLATLQASGVEVARVVLHVGLGTFLPIRADDVEEHAMHAERYHVPDPAQAALAAARREGRPIVPCGTTAVRAIEAFAASGAPEGETDLFIRPGYAFRLTDGLITNFHLPRSTLLLLVSALVGWPRLRAAYEEAVAAGYRFYSYGDAMLVAP